MNKTALIASVALVAGVVAIPVIRYNSLINQVADRFPMIDRKIIRKAYSTFMKNAADKKYGDMANFTDQKMDELFLEIVQKLTASK